MVKNAGEPGTVLNFDSFDCRTLPVSNLELYSSFNF